MPQDSVSSTVGSATSSAGCNNRLSNASLSSVNSNCFLCISESTSSDLSVDKESHPELGDILYSNMSDSACEVHRHLLQEKANGNTISSDAHVEEHCDLTISQSNATSSLSGVQSCELETVYELDSKESKTKCMKQFKTDESESSSIPYQEVSNKVDSSMKSERCETDELDDCDPGNDEKQKTILVYKKEAEQNLPSASKMKMDDSNEYIKQELIKIENGRDNQNQFTVTEQELDQGNTFNGMNTNVELLSEALPNNKIHSLTSSVLESKSSKTSAKEEDTTGGESCGQEVISSCWDSLHNVDAKDKDQFPKVSHSIEDLSDHSSDDSGWDSDGNDYYDVEEEEKRLKHQKRRVKRIQTVLNASELDLGALKELAARRNGYIKDALRRKVWPMLLQVQDDLSIPLLSEEEAAKYHSYNQVVMDVKRALKRFPPNLTDNVRDQLIDQVILVIMTVLQRHPEMHYYQGYHDVAVTFIMVCGEQRAVTLLEAVSLTHLREYLQPTMERTMRCQTFLYPILRCTRPLLYKHMMQCGVGTVFCLAWVITWYAHSVPDYSDVVRLYDFLLASPPLMPVYLAAAILEHRHLQLLEVECDMAMMHFALSQVTNSSDLPLDAMVRRAKLLYEMHPPSAIEAEVDQLLLEQKQQAEAEREERLRLRAARERHRNQPPAAAAPVWWLTRAVGAAVQGVTGRHGVFSVRGASTAVAVLAVMVGFTTLYYNKNYSGSYRLLQLPW